MASSRGSSWLSSHSRARPRRSCFIAVFWPHPEVAGPTTVGGRQAIAVSGALTAGWGVIAWCLRPGSTPEPTADRRAGRALATGLVVWAVIDSAVSVWMGAGANVIGNG